MVMDKCIGQMERYIKESGSIINKLEEVNYLLFSLIILRINS